MSTEEADTLAAAGRLETAMTGLSADIAGLRELGTRNRAMIYGLVGVSALVVAVLVGVIVLFVRVDHNAATARRASSEAAQAQRATHTTCLAGNDSRRLTRRLWGYVLTEAAKNPPPPGTSPAAQRAQIRQFRHYVDTTFADRDCTVPRT